MCFFNLQQTLSRVSIAAYQADTEAFTLVLQRAIAASIGSGVTFQDIYIAAVTAATRTGTGSGGGSRASTHATSSLRAQRHPGPDQAAAAAVNTLNTDAISVAYTVLSYISTVTNKDLSSLLQTAVDSGSFDTLLHQWASSQGVSALTGASSSAVSVNSFAADGGSGGGTEEGAGGGEEGTEDDGGENPITIIAGSAPTDSSSDSKTLPQILIIGIAAGGALLLIIVGTIYWCLAAKAPVSVATALPAGVELNSSASTATSAAAAAAADTAVPSAPMQMCSVFAAPAGDKSDAPVLAVAAPTAPAAVVRVTASDVQVYV